MPLYYGVTNSLTPIVTPLPTQVPIALAAGDTGTLFNNESIIAGQASIPFTVVGSRAAGSPAPACSFELSFSAAPGAFELDIQEAAATDADGFYATSSVGTTFQITAVNATTFIAWADTIPIGGKFVRVFMKTLTNAVKTTVKVTALA